jgi:ribosome-binding factor A
MANIQRLRRVADQIQRELSDLLRNEVRDPRIGMITLTGVEVSSDLAHAKVYYTTLGEGAERTETARGLKQAAGFLRSLLGKRLTAHAVPELHFIFDQSVERGSKLSRLIDDAVSDQNRDGDE